MAQIHSDEKPVKISITAEIWPAPGSGDGEFKSAVFDLGNGQSVTISDENEFNDFFEALWAVRDTLNW